MKFYGHDLNPGIINYNSSFRNKFNIIKILIEVARFMNISAPQSAYELTTQLDSDRIRLVFYIDKMSRIFIEEIDKIHSFHLPFILKVENGKYVLSFNDFQITNATCSILSSIFSELSEDAPLEKILELYWDVASDLSVPSVESEIHSQLITYLLSFEAGYLRFDHDEVRADKMYHPENHIDFNYTGGTTFKFGLTKPITHQQLIDMINSTTPCSYLSVYKK